VHGASPSARSSGGLGSESMSPSVVKRPEGGGAQPIAKEDGEAVGSEYPSQTANAPAFMAPMAPSPRGGGNNGGGSVASTPQKVTPAEV
jgi:hypothetical protein